MKAKIHYDSVVFECPACGHLHSVPFNLVKDQPSPIQWFFNGDTEKPTITPSIKNIWDDMDGKSKICHVNITDGQIYYHGDCTHEFAGKTLELPDLKPG